MCTFGMGADSVPWVGEVPFLPPLSYLKIGYFYDLTLRVSAPYFLSLF